MIRRVSKELYQKHRVQLTVLGVLVALTATAFLYRIYFVQGSLIETRREWSAFRQNAKLHPSATKMALYDAGVRDLALVKERFPRIGEFARVISDLFAQADSNSLSLGGVTYKPGKVEEGILSYSINLDATGSYGGIKSFITDLIRSRELISIESLSISKSGKIFEDEVTLRAGLLIPFRQEGK